MLRDIRHALRLLGRAPSFTILATVTIALGVGANTALFSVVNGVLLRPLPYQAPERLVFLDGAFARPEGDAAFQLSYPEFADIIRDVKSLAAAPWSTAWGLALEGADGAARLPANFVGRDYFGILGVSPLAGRTFAATEHDPAADDRMVAVISEHVWRQHFGADPGIIGRSVRLQARPFTVVGVMPASFHDVGLAYQERVDVWVPIERAPAIFGTLDVRSRGSRLMWGIGRLADGLSIDAARAELSALGARMAADHPQTNTGFSLRTTPLSQSFFTDARRPLWLLLGGSLFVLLIGCANVANLLLVRAGTRTREIAVRTAMGASRLRLIRQLLTEGLILSILGTMVGLVVALWITPVVLQASGIQLPGFVSVGIDRRVLAVASLTAVACGLLFGLAPIWRATRLSVTDTIAVSGTTHVARPSRGPMWLAGIEIATSFVLAAAALLALQSFSVLTRTDLAFETDRLLTVRLELPQDRYRTPAMRAQFAAEAQRRLAMLPGVERSILWGPSMFARSTWVSFIAPADQVVADHERVMVWRHSTNPGALRDLGIRIVSGRDLAPTDTLDAPVVAVVSEAAARRLWPGRDAVGQQFRSGAGRRKAPSRW